MPDFQIIGDWTVRVTDGDEIADFEIDPADILEITDEKYEKLPVFNPAGPEWRRGVPLRAVQAFECSVAGALVSGSLIVRAAPNGEPLTVGIDYQIDEPNGNIGRLEGGKIGPETPVYVSYRHIPMRIDSIVRDANGKRVLLKGTPHAATPSAPVVEAGATRLGNIYIPGFIEKLSDDNLFPILESEFPRTLADQGVAERLLPKTWEKLHNGQPLTILAWGDSVTAGGFVPENEGWQAQFVERLKKRFPNAKITLVTEAWGGRNSDTYFNEPAGAEHNYDEKVLAVRPDLIVSEFVNDAGFNAEKVAKNYGKMRDDFARIGAEWIILTPHYVRASWMGLASQKNIDDDPRAYVKAVRAFADENHIALADGSKRYGRLWRRGIPYITLMTNNINHPNGFGMGLFADALLDLF